MKRLSRKFVAILPVFLAVVFSFPLSAQEGEWDLFVSSRNTHSVKRFDGRTGEYLGDFIPTRSGGLDQAQEVAFGPDGHFYVSGRGNNAILRYDGRSGEFLGAFTSGYDLDNPTKMTFGPDGMLYVSQWGQAKSTVARFQAGTGAFIDEVTPSLNQGMAHTWDGEGRLYVASYGSKDVRRFDSAGSMEVFVDSTHLQSAVNLWFGSGGDLFVVDWETGSVERFGTESSYKGRFISGLTKAEGVTIGPDGMIYLCDWAANVVNRYDPETGELLGPFTVGGEMLAPNGLVFGPKIR